MLSRVIITTSEGTKTIQIPEWNECYHSQYGIQQEASHVFISNGLDLLDKPQISILEMGLGTGFNALLTLYRARERGVKVNYYALEKYPVSSKELEELEYGKILEQEDAEKKNFLLHNAEWEREVEIDEFFKITKFKADFFELKNFPLPPVDLVYFDAFGARVQPEFWEEELFTQVYNTMAPGGLLTTYSSKGSARRAMQSAGFTVEKKEGPKGKREMVNAWKK